MKHVSFLGAGSWGTALAILCANNGHQVTIWSKVKAETDMLKEHREHLERLPGVKLPDSIVIEEDLEKACTNQDIIVWSVASPFVRSTAQEAKSFIKDNQIIVNVGKGIEENTLMTLCEILEADGRCLCAFRTKPCGRSFPWSTNNSCCWSKDGKDGDVCAGCIYE